MGQAQPVVQLALPGSGGDPAQPLELLVGHRLVAAISARAGSGGVAGGRRDDRAQDGQRVRGCGTALAPVARSGLVQGAVNRLWGASSQDSRAIQQT